MPFGLRNVSAKTLATLQDSYKWRRLHVRTPLLVDVSLWVPLMSCAQHEIGNSQRYGQSWKNEVEFNDEKSHSFSRDRYNFKL
ncbi:hypothetical protein T12_16650 [Trichinella patagoniensis]|uniref:Uncharacterized protein n=1 Tax=Trichinella patagoniensis TaxID=990121 RepID=A0A0V0ZTT2_9BILA|nr:hypothetical protein T12_16650 [Trichinella patagoniensis]